MISTIKKYQFNIFFYTKHTECNAKQPLTLYAFFPPLFLIEFYMLSESWYPGALYFM
jgi:hypothetical protein